MGLFRKSPAGEPLPVTMAAVKLGDRFLSVGVRDPALVAILSAKAGLTGTACAVDADEAAVAKAAAAIERDGALAEVTSAPWDRLPYDDGSFDLAVVHDVLSAVPADVRSRAASELLRVVRPGGRVLIVETAPRAGFGALLHRQPIDATYASAGGGVNTLAKAGFAAVRELAERDGIRYIEGIKRA